MMRLWIAALATAAAAPLPQPTAAAPAKQPKAMPAAARGKVKPAASANEENRAAAAPAPLALGPAPPARKKAAHRGSSFTGQEKPASLPPPPSTRQLRPGKLVLPGPKKPRAKPAPALAVPKVRRKKNRRLRPTRTHPKLPSSPSASTTAESGWPSRKPA